MTSEWTRNLAAKALLLRCIAHGAQTGAQVLAEIEAASLAARRQEPLFDFVHWADGTVWDHLELFAQWGFIDHGAGRRPVDAYDWKTTTLSITEIGRAYLREAEAGAGVLMSLFASTEAERAVAQ
jgi:hypothetical protein